MAVGTALALAGTAAAIGGTVYGASKQKDALKKQNNAVADQSALSQQQQTELFERQIAQDTQSNRIDTFLAQVQGNLQNVPTHASGFLGVVNKSFDIIEAIRNEKPVNGEFTEEFKTSIKAKEDEVIEQATKLGIDYNAKINRAVGDPIKQQTVRVSNASAPAPDFLKVKRNPLTFLFIGLLAYYFLKKGKK